MLGYAVPMGSADLQTRHKGLQVEVIAQRKDFLQQNFFFAVLTYLGANHVHTLNLMQDEMIDLLQKKLFLPARVASG